MGRALMHRGPGRGAAPCCRVPRTTKAADRGQVFCSISCHPSLLPAKLEIGSSRRRHQIRPAPMDDNVTEEGPDELSTISGAHRSHREYRDGTKQVKPACVCAVWFEPCMEARSERRLPRRARDAHPGVQEHGRKPSRDYQSSPRESPRDGNTGIGIQFKTHPSSGILFVTSILKDGPSQNKGIITGDVVAEVDGIDVLDRAGAAKPWPFEKVSPLIKGTPGSVVSIAFLRPASSEHEEAGQKIPEGQLFRVKIRRQDKRSSAPASPRSTHLPGGGLAGPGVGWSGDTGGGGGAGLASPRAIGRLADDDSDVGRPDVSIEARLQAHARGAVNAAAMARKLMTTGAVRASASSELQSAGLASRTQQQHHSLPASAGPAMRADVGRRAHSEVLAQGGRGVAAGGGGRRIDRNHPVSSAERMLIANEVCPHVYVYPGRTCVGQTGGRFCVCLFCTYSI